jgi:hypothetical protein
MQFSFITTLDAGVPHLTGVTDLEVFGRGGVTTLYSGSEANGGLSVFTLSAGMAASFTDQIGASVNRGSKKV